MEAIKKFFDSSFYFIILAIAFVELMSFFSHFFYDIDHWFFVLIILLTLIVSLINIKYGVWLVLLELFIGSQGYLFHLDIGTVKISLRIGLWLVVLSACFKNYLFSLFDGDKRKNSVWLSGRIFKLANLPLFIILFFFILFGAARGFFQGNGFQNIFFDANAWLYFLLIFPIFEAIFDPSLKAADDPLRPIWRLLAAAAAWLCLKTFLLLFIFSHAFPETSLLHTLVTEQTYRWVRDTLIGEITLVPSGFIRIFIQSQIFVLIALFLGLFAASRFWMELKTNKKALLFFFAAGALLFGTILISFSRSFWVGGAIVIPYYAFWAIRRYGWKNFFSVVALAGASLAVSLGLILATVYFPVPRPSVSFDITGALTDRAGKINNEAALSSRYALLPELWKQIKTEPVWGSGFGATVTYRTSDPRVLEQNPSGLYTTYAFEWGWLDIWLKLGFFGLIAYLVLLVKIISDGYKKNTWLALGLGAGLLLITAVSIFSPYTNHPLGIGFLLLAAAAIAREEDGSCACA